MNQYEAMFLFDPTFGNSFEDCASEIRRLMERADAELLFCDKWDERRLAYKINGRKRGVYVLTYFRAPSEGITRLERDVKISEDILRVLILRADEVTREMMEDACAARGEERSPGDRKAEPSPDASPEKKGEKDIILGDSGKVVAEAAVAEGGGGAAESESSGVE